MPPRDDDDGDELPLTPYLKQRQKLSNFLRIQFNVQDKEEHA